MGRIITLTDVTLTSSELLTLQRLIGNAITFVAGAGTTGSDNGVGAAAKFNAPAGICIDPTDTTAYIADSSNHRIRSVDLATATVATLAGSGSAGGTDATGVLASFKNPFDICMDSSGTNLYCVDYAGHIVRKIVAATGVVTTIAGTYNSSGTTDADGAAARFKNPFGIAIDPSDTYLYVADSGNYRIRRITVAAPYTVTTIAGATSGDLDGISTAALFKLPSGVKVDPAGSYLYICDLSSHRVKRLNLSSLQVVSIAGSGSSGAADGFGLAALLNQPSGIELSADGKYAYIVEQAGQRVVRVRLSTGQVTTLLAAGTLLTPYALALTSGDAKMYIPDSGHHKILAMS